MKRVAMSILFVCMASAAQADENRVLVVPKITDGAPAPGHRVRRSLPNYAGTSVHHTLYLPTDWQPDKRYPVIIEYAGNRYKTSEGTVEGCSLGYGISAGEGVIWACVPFVDSERQTNATTWWGDVDATVQYCIETVDWICARYGGDPDRVVLAGFSRGAIACNYIGLRDDRIASLWCGFICHSHYDGVKRWPHPDSDRSSAARRLARLNGRPQFISHEGSVEATRRYLKTVAPQGDFTFVALAGVPHTDKWVLTDHPARRQLVRWFWKTVGTTSEAADSR